MSALLPPTEVTALAISPSASTLSAYLLKLNPLSLFKINGAYKTISACANINVPQLPTGINPLGPTNWYKGLFNAVQSFSSFALNTIGSGVIGAALDASVAGGLPVEIGLTIKLWDYPKRVVGLCEAGNPLAIVNCAAYAGTYSGTFTGGDQGTFLIAISSAGAISGSGVSASDGSFTLSGTVTANGTLTATTGTTSLASSFAGSIETNVDPYTVSGTWTNPSAQLSGTFFGQKK